ncbi:hypothetical protein AVEN_38275-1 [Araneus ventricosus]|uniref:Uncharacterized protein n=1 Tax=Araneus ventricosus TaxID=182803 RepID=A0A4Y2E897_ARAVE|nr:hypothetical protein AVEN_38275-1 [Araneus ventricosus]
MLTKAIVFSTANYAMQNKEARKSFRLSFRSFKRIASTYIFQKKVTVGNFFNVHQAIAAQVSKSSLCNNCNRKRLFTVLQGMPYITHSSKREERK